MTYSTAGGAYGAEFHGEGGREGGMALQGVHMVLNSEREGWVCDL